MVREMKHTEIGDIPADWEVQTFEETFRVLSNNTLSRAELNDRGGSFRNVHYGDILTRFTEVLDCSNEDIPFLNNTSSLTASAMPLQNGDVILADTAEDETVGKATEIAGLGDKKLVSGLHTIPCRAKKGDFAPGWLGYYMNSHAYHDQVLPYVTGIKVSSISKSAIAETLVLVPPKEEQKAIVESLSEIEMMIKNLENLIAKRKAIKQGLLQNVITGKIRLSGYENSVWSKRKLSSMGDLVKNSIDPCQSGDELFWEYSMPSYDDGQKPHHVYGRTMNSMRFNIQAPMLLFNKLNVRQKRVWVISDCPQCSVCSTEFLPYVSNDINLCFLRELLMTDNVTLDFESVSTGTSNSQKRISPNDFLEYEVYVPEARDEQDEIALLLTNVNNEIDSIDEERRKLLLIKQGMMSELLTGKVRLM